ncbi:imm11 family protein [Hahella sp. NBU794]|uniref:imm11 family protein n=1 Tax=Hahella sp. NBU794 TaxID=3422590 RepID=UPI003D6E7800
MYYILDRSCPGRWIEDPDGDIIDVDWYYWRRGAKLSHVPLDPLKFSLESFNPYSEDDSLHMPSYLQAAAPIFRDDLISALEECGINNLETYNAEISDPDNGAVYSNYKVVNIIGLISAADMQKSAAIVHDSGSSPLYDVDFDSLVIDPAKAGGHYFFRLAESTNALIVHEKVKQHLLAKGFTDLAFYEPSKVAL